MRTRRGTTKSKGLRVAVVGAGFGGIATAVKLARAGVDFTVFEQSAGPGGTWWDNHYPGAEVDGHVHAYSFSFMRYDWSRTHAGQAELQRYAEATIDAFGIRPRFRFSTRVVAVEWDSSASGYVVRLADGEELAFDIVVSCLGLLNQPSYPDWPGLDTFTGPAFHTARWEHEHDLRGARVAVVGTGSSGAQVVAALAPIVERLVVFQREPGWVIPKGDRDFTARERWLYRNVPLLQRANRTRIFLKSQFSRLRPAFDERSAAQQRMLETCRRYIESEISDPELRALVTPSYPWGCKRPVMTSTFYAALDRDNVDVVGRAVHRVTSTGLVDSAGFSHDVDVIVMATGFRPTEFLASLDVVGPDGISIHKVWAGDPRAFLGITVSGFPNFFMLYGPNTNGGVSIINQLERQAEVVVRTIKRMQRARARRVDTVPGALEMYVGWIDRELARRFSATARENCHNYYYSAAGRNVTQWPGSPLKYYVLTRVLPRLALRTHDARIEEGR